MALSYFHLRDGADQLLDPEGRHINDAMAISRAALTEARSLIATDVLSGHLRLDQRIEVEDGAGKIIHRLRFADAIHITPARGR